MLTEQTALYLSDVTFKTKDIDGETRKTMVCAWMLQPFTAEHAEAFGVKGRLFSLSDGEPLADLVSAALEIHVPLQRVEVRRGPDQSKQSVELIDVEVGGTLKVRKDKDGPVYCATFRTSSDYPPANALLVLAHGVHDQHFVTFAPEQQELINQEAQP